MRRNASYTTVGAHHHHQSDNGPDYCRYIYINEENNRRENATIFHSPYKNGKKNPGYSNPTFMSSDILYPREYVQTINKTPKKAIIPNYNDLKIKQLRQNRILGKSSSQLNIAQSRQKVNLSKSRSRVLEVVPVQNGINKRMKEELDGLKRQREVWESRISKVSRSKTPTKNEDPIYLEPQVDLDKIRHETKQMLQRYLRQALNLKKRTKQNDNNQKQTDKRLMDVEEKRFRKEVITSKQFLVERANLLKQLLINQSTLKK